MARRSLRPQLNQIRSWVREGRTDAWIAHKLEVTVQQIQAFKEDNDLAPAGAAAGGPGQDFDDEIDLRAEDDALIAAELEAAEAARAEEDARRAEEDARRAAEGDGGDEGDEGDGGDDEGEEAPTRRRRRSPAGSRDRLRAGRPGYRAGPGCRSAPSRP